MGTHPIFESDFDCLTDNRKMGLLKGVAVAAGCYFGLPFALGAVGFTSAGVAAGSAAAATQSAVYGGATTGLFSVCQSVGAAGLSASTAAGAGVASESKGIFKAVLDFLNGDPDDDSNGD